MTEPGLLFAPAFFPPAGRYLLMASCLDRAGQCRVVTDLRYDKRRKSLHRTEIADTRGPLRLTVPIGRPQGGAPSPLLWRDIAISRHDQWWNIHWVTLESAYGRTPFFEFYADRFRPFFSETTPETFPSIVDYDLAAERLVCELLLLPVPEPVEWSDVSPEEKLLSDDPGRLPSLEPYYQVRSDRFGFLPDLSVLDLLMNLGPEAALAIRGRL